MIKPKASFMVVINGPEATAGSILNLWMITGITAPTTLDKLSVRSNDTAIIIPKMVLP